MAAIDFPNSPAVNDIFTSGSKSWQWDGTTWNLLSTVVVNSLTGTASQVLVNATTGSAQSGALTLTLPQSIATSSTPQFGGIIFPNTTDAGLSNVAGTSYFHLDRSTGNSQWKVKATAGAFIDADTITLRDNAGTSRLTVGTTVSTPLQIVSTLAQGTAPMSITSTTQVDKLNANYVNGCIRPTTAQSSTIASPAASGVTTVATKWMADLTLPAQANAGRWIVMEKGVFTKTVATDAFDFGMSNDGGVSNFGMARWLPATGNTSIHMHIFGGFNAAANTAYTLSSYVSRQSGTGSISGPSAGDSRFHVIEAWFISST